MTIILQWNFCVVLFHLIFNHFYSCSVIAKIIVMQLHC